MEKILSYNHLLQKTAGKQKSFLLLYKPDGELSRCAYKKVESAFEKVNGASVFTANVSEVRDIHERFGISSVPSLLIFADGYCSNNIKGCQESNYYKALFENTLFQAKSPVESKSGKRVTVYSTPTCSWCNTLKSWLQKNNITYLDIDVSRNEKAAAELVKRTGQQGVPQTDINGHVVIGFDQKKLKELLEIY